MTALVDVIWFIIQAMTFAIFFRVILSWFMTNPRGGSFMTIYEILVRVTDPILAPLRRIIPRMGMFDLTPMVAIILLQIIGEIVVAALI